jgi:hypothetical protein
VQLTVFAEEAEGGQAGGGLALREVDAGEGRPEVLAQGGGDGLLAIVGELGKGVVVLR